MRALESKITESKFIRDALIMMIAMTLSNFFNYLYQLMMGRLLTPQEYGELFSLLSLFYLFSVVFTTINTSITKFTTVYATKGGYGKIKSLLVKASKNFALIGILVYGIVVLLSPAVSNFLKIEDSKYMIVLFASIPFGLILPAYQGVLRGLQRFPALGTSMVSWALFKLLFGVAFVVLGYGVLGGLAGVFLAHVAAFLITLLFLQDLLSYEGFDAVELEDIIRYSGLAFLAIFAYTTMWNIDVIIVKHSLSPLEAGNYSAISVLGKIVLFAPGAVGIIVFPKAAEKHESGVKHSYILIKGLVLAMLISSTIVIAYALFPETIIRIIYGEKYLTIAPYLWKYGLAMMFFSMIGVMVNYALSVNIMNISWLILVMLIVETIMLSAMRDIPQIINTLTLIGFMTVIILATWIWRQK